MTTYSYTKYIDDDRLRLEIMNSAITIALDSVVITGEETVDVIFKADLPAPDKAILDELILTHINQPITVRDSVELANVDITSNAEKAIKMAPTKLEGSSTQKVSHDFCDPTTWYTDSVRQNDETLTTLDNLIFSSQHVNWIDLSHGKVPYEHRLLDTYKPIVKVNGAVVDSGFTIDYKLGKITFDSEKSGSTIIVDYSYANGSAWSITPAQGKILKILGTVIKFTSDASFGQDQAINFQLYVGGNPYGSPTMYKNMKDILKCTGGEAPSVIAGFGDVTNDVITIPFDYITSKDLKSSLDMEIKIWLSQHSPITGEFGIVSAYCISVSE